jgi:tetratricopeptide (TPR) repeat protein
MAGGTAASKTLAPSSYRKGATTMRVLKVSALAAALSLSGCATYQANWAEAPKAAAAVDDKAKMAIDEGEALWEQRTDKTKLMAAIAKWEATAATTPTVELFSKLSRAHYLLGDGYYNLENNVEARDAEYQKGLDSATTALKLAAPAFAKAMADGKKHAEVINLAPKEAVPAMYWYASNLGRWAATKGFATRLRYKDDIKATIDHVKSLDENFFFAAPYRYLGGYEAQTAGLAGGSLEKSEEYFKKAVELAPSYLGTKVLWADFLCQKKRDKAMFKKLLDEVVAADPKADAQLVAENTLEQEKAKRLLAKIDELF